MGRIPRNWRTGTVVLRRSVVAVFGGALLLPIAVQSVGFRSEAAVPIPLAVAGFADASQGTPTSKPNGELCDVQPRPTQDFAALASASPGALVSWRLGTPVASPTAPSGGVSAGTSVVAAVIETVEEHIACTNAGDLPQITSLWTDEYFQRQFGGVDLATATAWATPQPVPDDQQATLVSVDEVKVLPDGIVTAVVRTDRGMSLVAFREVNDHLLIGGSYLPNVSGTPVP